MSQVIRRNARAVLGRVALVRFLRGKHDRHQRKLRFAELEAANLEVVVEGAIHLFETLRPRRFAAARMDDQIMLRRGHLEVASELSMQTGPHLAGRETCKLRRGLL